MFVIRIIVSWHILETAENTSFGTAPEAGSSAMGLLPGAPEGKDFFLLLPRGRGMSSVGIDVTTKPIGVSISAS
jgi:hypothetical protein